MATKRHKPEEIVTKLRQVDVLVGQGMVRVDAIRHPRVLLLVDPPTSTGWCEEYEARVAGVALGVHIPAEVTFSDSYHLKLQFEPDLFLLFWIVLHLDSGLLHFSLEKSRIGSDHKLYDPCYPNRSQIRLFSRQIFLRKRLWMLKTV